MKKQALIIGIVGVFLFIQPMGAQTWTATKRLTWNAGNSYLTSIAVGSNNHIYVMFEDNTPGNFEIFYNKSTDEGATWKTKRLTWASGFSQGAAVALDSSNHIHVVWNDSISGNWEIHYKKSTNGGTTWTAKRLSWTPATSGYPSITVDSNDHIHVFWEERKSTTSDIYYKKSTDGGATWTTKRLTWTSGWSYRPSIAVDSNSHIHVVWEESTPGYHEIFYKKSTNGGGSWTTKRLTWKSYDSDVPKISVDSSNHIHVVWYDYTPGNYEIFYRKGIQ